MQSMSASIETGFHQVWNREPTHAAHWDDMPTEGAHAWLGLLLLLGTSIVTIRVFCWMAAQMIRLFH